MNTLSWTVLQGHLAQVTALLWAIFVTAAYLKEFGSPRDEEMAEEREGKGNRGSRKGHGTAEKEREFQKQEDHCLPSNQYSPLTIGLEVPTCLITEGPLAKGRHSWDQWGEEGKCIFLHAGLATSQPLQLGRLYFVT